MKLWLASADGVIFNYRRGLTSGAASLARSLGLPIIIHQRMGTVDLMEPNPSVFRYASLEGDFKDCLEKVVALRGKKFERNGSWSESIGWTDIAMQTIKLYQKTL